MKSARWLSIAALAAVPDLLHGTGNRLAGASSPYLRQHADHPVHWQPWDEAALALAKRENRPIFVSSGFSTCHWCHVMARESFADPDVAAFLNAHFVNIKLDREERPDIDRIYLAFVAATTGRGGWPLNVWLTPDLQPFFGGTYFPPVAHDGLPAFIDVARAAAHGWADERSQVIAHAALITDALRRVSEGPARVDGRSLDRNAADNAFDQLNEDFDEEHGGFGRQAKFADAPKLHFLFRYAVAPTVASASAKRARHVALVSLSALVEGDLHDTIGGGFHRYAEERAWRRPHYEKMLYDQALVVSVLLDAYQLTGEQRWAEIARSTLAFIERELTSPAGAFFAALDAESLPAPKEVTPVEGAYYAATPEERAKARRDSDARAHLLTLREQRPRPHRDEKIVAAWNGYAISAFARAHVVLGDATYLTAATRAAERLRHVSFDESSGRLSRVPGQPVGFAEDYAAVISALLDLHAAGFDPGWLDWALTLQATQDQLFADEGDGAYFNTAADDASVLVRLKEDFDDAEPSANALAAHNLRRLAVVANEPAFQHRLNRILEAFAPLHTHTPAAMPVLLSAALVASGQSRQIVIAGDPEADDTRDLLHEARRRFDPFATILLSSGPSGEWLAHRLGVVAAMQPIAGRSAAYVCEDFVCNNPVTDVASLARLLDHD